MWKRTMAQRFQSIRPWTVNTPTALDAHVQQGAHILSHARTHKHVCSRQAKAQAEAEAEPQAEAEAKP